MAAPRTTIGVGICCCRVLEEVVSYERGTPSLQLEAEDGGLGREDLAELLELEARLVHPHHRILKMQRFRSAQLIVSITHNSSDQLSSSCPENVTLQITSAQ